MNLKTLDFVDATYRGWLSVVSPNIGDRVYNVESMPSDTEVKGFQMISVSTLECFGQMASYGKLIEIDRLG